MVSPERVRKYENIIHKDKSIFKILLASRGPANVTSTNTILDKARKPVRVKVQKYPTS